MIFIVSIRYLYHIRNMPHIKEIVRVSHFNRTFIAFKGGRYEKDLSEKNGARSAVVLEHLGCTKFNELFQRSDLKNIIHTI